MLLLLLLLTCTSASLGACSEGRSVSLPVPKDAAHVLSVLGTGSRVELRCLWLDGPPECSSHLYTVKLLWTTADARREIDITGLQAASLEDAQLSPPFEPNGTAEVSFKLSPPAGTPSFSGCPRLTLAADYTVFDDGPGAGPVLVGIPDGGTLYEGTAPPVLTVVGERGVPFTVPRGEACNASLPSTTFPSGSYAVCMPGTSLPIAHVTSFLASPSAFLATPGLISFTGNTLDPSVDAAGVVGYPGGVCDDLAGRGVRIQGGSRMAAAVTAVGPGRVRVCYRVGSEQRWGVVAPAEMMRPVPTRPLCPLPDPADLAAYPGVSAVVVSLALTPSEPLQHRILDFLAAVGLDLNGTKVSAGTPQGASVDLFLSSVCGACLAPLCIWNQSGDPCLPSLGAALVSATLVQPLPPLPLDPPQGSSNFDETFFFQYLVVGVVVCWGVVFVTLVKWRNSDA